MFDLDDLYQQVILDHNRSPRNFKRLEDPDRDAEGYNPLCGDRYHIFVKLDGDRISDIGFEGEGCAISKSAASVMTELVKGKTTDEIQAIMDSYQKLVTGKDCDLDLEGPLAKLAVFKGVSAFPVRVKCAVLAWHALKACLEQQQQPVSTE